MPATCAFCAIIRGEEKAAIILETDRLMAFLDHRPLFLGHTLLVPKQHVVLLSDLPPDEVPAFFTLGPAPRASGGGQPWTGRGSLILINNVISQSVPHLHLHVIPPDRKTACASGSARARSTTRRPTPRRTRNGSGAPFRRTSGRPAPSRLSRACGGVPWGTQAVFPFLPILPLPRPSCPPTTRVPTVSHATCSIRCPHGTTGWPRFSRSGRTDDGVRPWSRRSWHRMAGGGGPGGGGGRADPRRRVGDRGGRAPAREARRAQGGRRGPDRGDAAGRAPAGGVGRDGHRIGLIAGRAEQLPFPDGHFDALTFTYLLRYVAGSAGDAGRARPRPAARRHHGQPGVLRPGRDRLVAGLVGVHAAAAARPAAGARAAGSGTGSGASSGRTSRPTTAGTRSRGPCGPGRRRDSPTWAPGP